MCVRAQTWFRCDQLRSYFKFNLTIMVLSFLFCSCIICYLMILTTSHALPGPVLREMYSVRVRVRRKTTEVRKRAHGGHCLALASFPGCGRTSVFFACTRCVAVLQIEKSPKTNKRSSLRGRSCFQALWDSGAAKRSNGHRLLASGVVFRRWSHVDAF